jgi:hypothetical protein
MTVGSGVAVVVVFLSSVRVAMAWTGSTIMAAVVWWVRVLLGVLLAEREVKRRGLPGEVKMEDVMGEEEREEGE